MSAKSIDTKNDRDPLKQLRETLPDDAAIERLSEFFKVFGDGTRLRLLSILARQEMRVADLATAANLGQSAVPHQLQILRLNRLVKFRREGTTLFYSLDDDHIERVFAIALEHIREGQPG